MGNIPNPIDELHHFSRWWNCTTNRRIFLWIWLTNMVNLIHVPWANPLWVSTGISCWNMEHTVDGCEILRQLIGPAVDIPLFIGFQPSKVMQDFFHPQYVYGCLWELRTATVKALKTSHEWLNHQWEFQDPKMIKWRYMSTIIFGHMNWGYIPLHKPYIGHRPHIW